MTDDGRDVLSSIVISIALILAIYIISNKMFPSKKIIEIRRDAEGRIVEITETRIP